MCERARQCRNPPTVINVRFQRSSLAAFVRLLIRRFVLLAACRVRVSRARVRARMRLSVCRVTWLVDGWGGKIAHQDGFSLYLVEMRNTSWLAVGGAVSAAVLVAMHLRRRMKQSALENCVGGDMRKKALAKRRERRKTRQLAADKAYYAFVSHMKVEAAMEARFLQIELEALHAEDEEVKIARTQQCTHWLLIHFMLCLRVSCLQLVFLDSDDLRDLSKLVQHVKDSRCLILVQTRKVLSRPYCILEVLTAIQNRVPIVTVTVGGKQAHDAYNFEEMSCMLTFLESELEHWNPGVRCTRGSGLDLNGALVLLPLPA